MNTDLLEPASIFEKPRAQATRSKFNGKLSGDEIKSLISTVKELRK